MSRKHYTEAARIIHFQIEKGLELQREESPSQQLRGEAIVDTANAIARELASMFKEDNPQFDRARFFGASGAW